jgi:hypothetical protein
MWNSLKALFYTERVEQVPSTPQTETHAPKPTPAPFRRLGFHHQPQPQPRPAPAPTETIGGYQIPILTQKSPRKDPPAFCKIPLWDHQKAMLNRCFEIERNSRKASTTIRNLNRYDKEVQEEVKKLAEDVPIGIMMDPPGCGKTYALLTLAAESTGTTLIIVPHNIYHQWENAIKTLLPEDFPYKCMATYADVNDMFRVIFKPDENPLSGYKIVLVNDAFAESVAQTLFTTRQTMERVIIDEVDSVQSRLMTPIFCKHMWLVSASFQYNEFVSVGPYKINKEDIPFVFCKTEQSFMDASVGLEPPTSTKYICDDANVRLFDGILTDKTFRGFHAGDIKSVYLEMGVPPNTGLVEIAEKFITDHTGERDKELEENKSRLEAFKKAEQATTIEGKKLEIQANILKVQATIDDQTYQLKKRDRFRANLTTYTPADPAKSKGAIFKSTIIPEIKANPAQRWLICNDYYNPLAATYDELQAAGIKCEMLDGGNSRKLQQTIDGYKKGDTQVLLLNAKVETVGMNLENTTHLLFMHATKPEMVAQVVGRAHRFGRTGPLEVVGLFNTSEEAIIMSEK